MPAPVRRPNEAAALFVFNTLCLTAIMAFMPVIGPVVRGLRLAEWHGGLVVTVAGVLWMLMARYWGGRSDRVGRRRVLLRAAAGYIVSYLLLAIGLDLMLREPPPVWLALLALMALRALIGAFYAAMPTVSAARIADITAPEQRGAMMARLGAANGLGMVLGPAIGGLLVKDSLTLPLYIAAVLPLLGTLWLAAKLPSDAAHEPRVTPPLKLSDRRLRLPLAAMLLAMSAVITAQMIVGFYAMDALRQEPGPAARTAGWAMTTVGVMLILVQVGLAKARRMNAARCLAGGALLSGVGFLLVPVLGGAEGLVTCYAIMAAGMGLVFPSIQTLAANAVTADEQGIAAGSVIAVQGMAMVVAPLVCTLLYGVRPWVPYVVAASLLLLVALAAAVKPRVATSAPATP
ncbi:MFS transporter [Achromobacter xylosoxidans]|uniref:MFS transporter n=1 Tax=Alcaligenes xylosoxydans xylosoxydans TaxID=85698 RepID=UPI001F12A8D7|nr:MFS transporter [Achromobacter xylosoxidans]